MVTTFSAKKVGQRERNSLPRAYLCAGIMQFSCNITTRAGEHANTSANSANGDAPNRTRQTQNEERRTKNEEQGTKNKERRTKNEELKNQNNRSAEEKFLPAVRKYSRLSGKCLILYNRDIGLT